MPFDKSASRMPKNIAIVGTSLPVKNCDYIELQSRSSLLDYDIIVINPDISDFDDRYSQYKGKPAISDASSFNLREAGDHWRREISEAITAGKTVFVLMNEATFLYAATGEKQHSGTGKNRQTTRIVNEYKNYALISNHLNPVTAKGKAMELSPEGAILDSYWKTFEAYSEYRVLVPDSAFTPLVVTKSGKRTTGAMQRSLTSKGTLVLLPYVDFDHSDFSEDAGGEEVWTDQAMKLGSIFLAGLVGIASRLRAPTEFTPPPEWLNGDRFMLPKEQKIRTELLDIEMRIETLNHDKEVKQAELLNEAALKALLYEKGDALEVAVRAGLRILGFEVTTYKSGDSEFDIVCECSEGRIIGEVEGKDNKPINIDKLRQLEMNLHEDFGRDEVMELAKGVLIGNAHRLTPPEDRSGSFTDKCLVAAKRSTVALLTSEDLFAMCHKLLKHPNKSFAKKCRTAILKSVGLVQMPKN